MVPYYCLFPSIKHLCIISSDFCVSVIGLARSCLNTDFCSTAGQWSIYWICFGVNPLMCHIHSSLAARTHWAPYSEAQTFCLVKHIFFLFPFVAAGILSFCAFSFFLLFSQWDYCCNSVFWIISSCDCDVSVRSVSIIFQRPIFHLVKLTLASMLEWL